MALGEHGGIVRSDVRSQAWSGRGELIGAGWQASWPSFRAKPAMTP